MIPDDDDPHHTSARAQGGWDGIAIVRQLRGRNGAIGRAVWPMAVVFWKTWIDPHGV